MNILYGSFHTILFIVIKMVKGMGAVIRSKFLAKLPKKIRLPAQQYHPYKQQGDFRQKCTLHF